MATNKSESNSSSEMTDSTPPPSSQEEEIRRRMEAEDLENTSRTMIFQMKNVFSQNNNCDNRSPLFPNR